MVRLIRQGVYFMDGRLVKESEAFMTSDKKEAAQKNTIVRRILAAHDAGAGELELKPDAALLYGQTDVLRALDFWGFEKFPLPVYLFGGRDDGFVRSAAKKWGGAFLPEGVGMHACCAEQVAKSGALLFDTEGVSCGALGAMNFRTREGDLLRLFSEGGTGEPRRDLLALYLKGKLRKGTGPVDVALAVLRALKKAGNFAAGKYLEVFGAGEGGLSMDCRIALDHALGGAGIRSSVWATDAKTEEYFETRLRGGDFKPLAPVQPAYYDGAVIVDLSEIEPMIEAGGEIETVEEYSARYAQAEGRAFLGETALAPEYATYETVSEMAEILREKEIGGETACSLSPYSRSVALALSENGSLGVLLRAGVDLEGGRCGDVRSGVLLDGRTMAATLANGGYLTSALGLDYNKRIKKYKFDPAPYESRALQFFGKSQKGPLAYGATCAPLPQFPPLPERLELAVDGKEGDLAIVLRGEYAWSQAIADRERGAFAALAQTFPEKLRVHLLDWGILPLAYEKFDFKEGDVLILEHIAEAVRSGAERILGKVIGRRRTKDVALALSLTDGERKIVLAGGKNNLLRGIGSGSFAG